MEKLGVKLIAAPATERQNGLDAMVRLVLDAVVAA